MKSSGNYALCNHHPGVDCVHADFARAEFLRQCSRDRIDRAFRCVVNNRSRWSQGTGERTNVDDTAAVGVEMLQRLLSGEEHSEDICIKHSVELLLGDFFQRDELIHASVIDHDVYLAESLLRFSEQYLVDDSVCALLVRRIIDHYRRARLRELFRNPRADSLRRSRYYRNFSI